MVDFVLSQYPSGVMDLLGIQSSGKGPQLFSEVVSPSFDLAPYYFARNSNLSGNTFTADPAGIRGLTSPPVGTVRLIRQISVKVVLAAGQAGKVGLVLLYPNGGIDQECFITDLAGSEAVAPAAGLQQVAKANFEFPLILRAGNTISARTTTAFGAGSSYQWAMHYVDVRAGV